jgi:hypothetical protein
MRWGTALLGSQKETYSFQPKRGGLAPVLPGSSLTCGYALGGNDLISENCWTHLDVLTSDRDLRGD